MAIVTISMALNPIQPVFVVAVSVKGGLKGVAAPLCGSESSSKCLCHVYLQMHGEVAERLKAAVC